MERSILKSGPPTPTMGDRVFKGVGDLIKLLPSGTVFLFQFLSPLLTNNGQCHTVNKYACTRSLAQILIINKFIVVISYET